MPLEKSATSLSIALIDKIILVGTIKAFKTCTGKEQPDRADVRGIDESKKRATLYLISVLLSITVLNIVLIIVLSGSIPEPGPSAATGYLAIGTISGIYMIIAGLSSVRVLTGNRLDENKPHRTHVDPGLARSNGADATPVKSCELALLNVSRLGIRNGLGAFAGLLMIIALG